MKQITFAPTFEGWRAVAREALAAGLEPADVAWEEWSSSEPGLPMFEERVAEAPPAANTTPRVPKEFMEIAKRVACHRDRRRWALLYSAVWRLTHGEHHLFEMVTDPIVHELNRMDKSVRHDLHKMRAFVRFRETSHEGTPWFVAWFEPEHYIVELNAPFFRDRFHSMHWSILTPERCVHWDGGTLSFTDGVPKSEAPTEDQAEALLLKYYSHIFNPARVKVAAMQSEMPKKYWKNLPEAAVIPALLNEAPARVTDMISRSRTKTGIDSHPAEVPDTRSLSVLREAAAHCKACPLYANATQTVFGEGPRDARIIFVGEQPGDNEDREGHPFVGPAGQLFDRALQDAGIDRQAAYVTNAVKHFKWEPRGKRRLHAKPGSAEIAACRPWILAEIGILRPEVLVLLGSTATQSLLGSGVKVMRDRGRVIESEHCAKTVVTVHPSSLLRAPDPKAKEEGYAHFVADLRLAAGLL